MSHEFRLQTLNSAGNVFFYFFVQSKRKLDPRKGRSQSSGEDVVWFSLSVSFAASLYLFHKCHSLVLSFCSSSSSLF